MSELSLQSALLTLLCGLLVAYGLALAVRRMHRIHPGLAIGGPIAIGFAARLVAVAAVDGTGLSGSLRGGDESTFLFGARDLVPLSWTSPDWIAAVTHHLHVAVFAGQIRLLHSPPTALRMFQIAIAMAGLMFLIAAVHRLAGPQAARLAAWLLMLEPAGVFFDSALHKEPMMLLASGVVVYGCARIWQGLDAAGILIAAIGSAIAVATRGYAGWFLVSGVALLILHAALRRLDRPLRAMPLIYVVVLGAFLVMPTLLQVSSQASLRTLQISQDANSDPRAKAASTGANGNNLALERVDFSSREEVLANLPRRITDVLLKPYPWQVANTSEVLGAVGSLVALTGIYLLLRYAWRARGSLIALTAPIAYPLLFLLVAYALSTGNAGTGFRYRTHIVTLSLAMLIVLRSHLLTRGQRPIGARSARALAPRRASLARPAG